MRRTGFLVVVLFGMAGCVALADSPMVTRQLKLVSAEHTGSLAD
jgi:hypothetical protein